MKVILQKDLKDTGKVGDVISVKPGFARNFLFPRHLALKFTQGSLKQEKHYKELIEKKIKKAEVERGKLVEQLDGEKLSFKMSVNEEEGLFGSISAVHISKELVKKGFEVGKKDILLKSPLKSLGSFEVDIDLGIDRKAKISVLLEKI